VTLLDRLRRNDHGSVPLAMVAAIVVGGLSVTVAAGAIAAQDNVQFDTSYTRALQAADQGVQEAVALANQSQNLAAVCGAGSTDPRCSGSSESGSWAWTATWDAATSSWTVTSVGEQGGVDRQVTARVTKNPRFPVAAFGDLFIQLVGNNTIASYNSATGADDTGNGAAGSNGNIRFNGSSTTVDSVALYNNDSAGNTCTSNGGTACDEVDPHPDKLDLASTQNMSFIDQVLQQCSASGPLTNWASSAHGGVLAPAPAGYLCVDDIIFDQNTRVTGTATNPVVIYARGSVSIERGVTVNCDGCTASSRPPTSNLLVFSAGVADTEPVGIGNHSVFAGGIYAPRAACVGNNSGAQAIVFGSLICGRIGDAGNGNQGGWTFLYDDALGRVSGDGVSVSRWDED
jgi:hypothetical protein